MGGTFQLIDVVVLGCDDHVIAVQRFGLTEAISPQICVRCATVGADREVPRYERLLGVGASGDMRWSLVASMRILRRMPRVQVYLPDDLHEELKQRGLPASELLQIALRAELERQDALDETARYLDELVAEVGEPNQRQRTRADAIARRIRDRSRDRVN